MKKFSILRYVRQFSLLILLLVFAGSVGIYRYGKSQQRYIASAVIRYTNTGAKDGYTPDGSPLNVDEIYSSSVIDAALKDLGYESSVDAIRSRCYVEEVIPDQQQKLNEVLLEKGEETIQALNQWREPIILNILIWILSTGIALLLVPKILPASTIPL